MALVETTRSRTHRRKSATDVMASRLADLDWRKIAGAAVWLVFCVLLIVLA